MILALFAGIGDLFLALTLKKPKENQCFWLRTLKNLRKINVFALPEHLVTLGAPLGTPPNRFHFGNKFDNHFCINGPLVRDLETIIGAFCMSWRCASFFFDLKKWFLLNGSLRGLSGVPSHQGLVDVSRKFME